MASVESKYLSMKFVASADGSSKTIRLNDPKNDITQSEVQDFMNSIVSGQLLHTSKGSLCDQVDSAVVVDRTNNELFNLIS